MPHHHWGKIRGLVHMMRVFKKRPGGESQFPLPRRRAAENLQAYYIRMHPTPRGLSNANVNNFRATRRRKGWNWALRVEAKQHASPNRTATASSPARLGGGFSGPKSKSTKSKPNLRAKLLKAMKKNSKYKPTNRSTR